MPTNSKEVSDQYIASTDKLCAFVNEYHQIIEGAQRNGVIEKVLFYPSLWALTFNAKRRVEHVSAALWLKGLSTKYLVQPLVLDQAKELPDAFSRRYPQNNITLLFTVGSSSLIGPILSYAGNALSPKLIPSTTEFMLGATLFSAVFILAFNYYDYSSKRKEMKRKCSELSKEICSLKA